MGLIRAPLQNTDFRQSMCAYFMANSSPVCFT